MKKFFVFVLVSVLALSASFAISLNQLHIVADDGTFLGTFENEYAANSIYNEYGSYGSPYSAKSIMNRYSNYGSEYSNLSPSNKYAQSAPWIVDRYGNTYGRLSLNKYAPGVTKQSYQLALELYALQCSF
ncbi:MAG: hypothetical protein II811_01955 [Spirochaetaceae bacterium]|nr:hypothetical protein [Spirochaetaceae bacterium]